MKIEITYREGGKWMEIIVTDKAVDIVEAYLEKKDSMRDIYPIPVGKYGLEKANCIRCGHELRYDTNSGTWIQDQPCGANGFIYCQRPAKK